MLIHVSRQILPAVVGQVDAICAHCGARGHLARHETTVTGYWILKGRSVDALVCPQCNHPLETIYR